MGSRRAAWAVVAGLLLGGNAGADDAAHVAEAAGQVVTKGDLADFLFERRRETWLDVLQDLVDDRLARAQAARFGLAVPADVLDRAVEAEVKARERQLKETYGEGADLPAAVAEAYGTDVGTWRRTVLRPRLEAQLLLHRVVRLDARRRQVIEVRVVVFDDAERAARVRDKVLAGADFGLTALQESKDPTAKDGGALPPIARGDLAFPGVEERLFAASAGAVVGPLEVLVEGRRQWQLYKVVRRLDPWPGDPAGWGARLEADLAERPAQRAELLAWRRRARREHGVVFRAPDGTPLTPR